MAYNILGINPFHNGSVCVLSDGKVIYFLEEERLSRLKKDANPFRVILDIINKYQIDEIALAGINLNDAKLNYSLEDPFLALIRKFNIPIKNTTQLSENHHLTHLYHSLYNSGFSKALGIVIDGGGSQKSTTTSSFSETDSIYDIQDTTPKLIYTNKIINDPKSLSKPVNISSAFNATSLKLGFNLGDEGKVMGLSSYGNKNPKIPVLFDKSNISDPLVLGEKNLTNWREWYINLDNFSRDYSWHKSPPKITDLEKDLAWRIQNDSQEVVKNYIKTFTQKTKHTNIVCSGGYFLNCVSNYYLTKEFPNLNFYFEPISHDGGTAIGAAYIRWKELNPNFTPSKQKTLYYGSKYSKEELLEGIKNYI